MGNGGPHNPYNNSSYIQQPASIPIPPVDEDDYLQPKSANPEAYLDLENNKGVVVFVFPLFH